ncbi:LysR substrate-binding domain-containing protein [Kitasatospora kifunensis]|uniref:DNA-binding transcriptional LysR family regulator n=1 Tax=Kitasatospora kifunensis TaxID=58351 RepID=A0A7W7VVT5_KITKI|nr:LysR substrate-binding domain-containing protein [Kitasatospora kifunensis]MBB4924223.1 DNA-binding transcriptional LysR family regulator [Kitasatospora kifunensis]
MELRQVRYFLAVAEELHFGRAAERLHIVQPTVSQQIRRLERELGVDLFDRTTRTVALTVAGSVFVAKAQAILDAERAALTAMAEQRAERSSVLRVGTNVGLGSRLERILAALDADVPGLCVELVSAAPAERLQQVRDGQLDAAFVRGVTRSPGLELIPLWQDELVAALPASHPLAERESVELGELAELALRIVPREANPYLVDLVVDACRAAGFEPVLGPAFTTDQDTLAAIGAGRAAWTVFYAAQAAMLPVTRAVFRPFAGQVLRAQSYLAVHPANTDRNLSLLLDACRNSLDGQAASGEA